MGGIAKSAGGFLGLSSGPTVGTQTDNQALNQLNNQNKLYYNTSALDALNNYATGKGSSSDALNLGGLSPDERTEMGNALSTGATTGSKFATEQVQNNPILGGLFGKGGQLENEEGQYGQQSNILDKLQNQGFQLTPDDQTLYGQTSGAISRLFGQQENAAAQSLADRGLAAGPSGVAGVTFSGLAGNKNEMLQNAQMQIMQQRFQNTQNQIAQQQGFLSSLGGNINNLGQSGANAINQQYGRQLAGAQNQKSGLESTAQIQNQANAGANQANLGAANFAQANKPQNAWDMAQGGANSALGAGGKTYGQAQGAKAAGVDPSVMFGA